MVNLENDGRLIQMLDVRELLGKRRRPPAPAPEHGHNARAA
ncbi:MAG: hypothetical protein ACE5FN_11590 [Leptospirillia bacterium]